MSRRLTHCLFALPCLVLSIFACAPAPADAAMLWYNGDYDNRDALANGTFGVDYNGGKIEISKVYENFVVPVGQTWTITSVYSVNEINNFSGLPITTASWEIRTGVSAGIGGTVKAFGNSSAATVTALSQNSNFTYAYSPVKVAASVPAVVLSAGSYWLSVVADDSSVFFGDQSFVETTSGLNAVGTPAGNDGNSFITNNLPGAGGYNFAATSTVEGPGKWDYVMGVDGTAVTLVPEPSSLVLVALGGLGVAAFSRARSRKVAA